MTDHDVRALPPPSTLSVLQILPRLETDGATRSAIDIARGVIEQGGRAFIASAGGTFVGEFRQAGGYHIEIPIESKMPWNRMKATSLGISIW